MKMKKTVIALLGLFFIQPSFADDTYAALDKASFATTSYAAPDQAAVMLEKAVAYLKANGKQKAISEFSKPQGQFVNQNLHISVVDLNGKILADGASSNRVGKSVSQFEDFNEEIYFEKVDNLIIACGAYSG